MIRTFSPIILLLLLWIIAGCGGPQLVDTPVLYEGAADNPFADVAPSNQHTSVTLIYGTDRMADQPEKSTPDGSVRYGYGRASSLSVGTCRVDIGNNLTWEQLVADSRTNCRSHDLPIEVGATIPAGTYAPTDNPITLEGDVLVEDHADVTMDRRAEDALHRLLAEQLADAPRKEVFVFVHGYHNTFDDAALRMAQLWHFLGRPGVAAIYSWPAGYEGGPLRGYTRDRESGEFSVYHFKQFIRTIAASPEVQKIHFIAHSRGTDVLTTALRELHIENLNDPLTTRRKLKLGQVVLAAPDLDFDVATQRILAERLGAAPEGVTVYLNAEDRAIGISDWLFASIRRLGQLRATDLTDRQRNAFERLGRRATFVDVRSKVDFVGHGYFVSNPSVLSDLILLLRDNRPPGPDHGRPLIQLGASFWELYNGYPNPK